MAEKHLDVGLQGEPFASGDEKDIYEHHDPQKIVKVTVDDGEGKFEAGNERYIKAEFYLTKILHLLFPDTIPDIHGVSFKHQATIHERKELDEAHRTLQNFYHKANLGEDVETGEKEQKAFEISKQRKQTTTIIQRLQNMGIVIDRAHQNFAEDKKGSVIYLDSIIPWKASHRLAPDMNFTINFNVGQLHEIITEELSEPEKTQALHYLDRLTTLADEERAAHDALPKV